MAIDPLTSVVYTGGEDKKINIWNIKKGSLLGTLSDHRGAVEALAISSDGKLLISGGNDNEIRIWQTSRRKAFTKIKEPTNRVVALSFHPSNRYFAWINGVGKVNVWDLEEKSVVSSYQKRTGNVTGLTFSAKGNHIALASMDKTIVYWNWRTNEHPVTLKGHEKAVASISFHPEGKIMLSCSLDGAIKLWNLKLKKAITNLNLDEKPVVDCSFSSDGNRILSVFKKNYAKTWSLGDRGYITSLKGHTDSILSLDIAVNGKSLVSVSLDNTIKVWAIGGTSKKLLQSYPIPNFKIQQVRFAPDNFHFATSGNNAEIRIWDLRKKLDDKDRFVVLKGHRGKINTIDFHPTQNLLVSGGADKYVYLWDTHNMQLKRKYSAHDTQITDIRFSPKGNRYATASLDRTVKIWNTENDQLMHILKSHNRGVRTIAFSEDGTKLASASDDRFIRLWEVSTGKRLHVLSGHDFVINGIHFSEDGKTLISSSRDKTIRIWHVDDGTFIRTLTGERDQITSMAVNNSAGLLAIGGLGPDINLLKLPQKYFNFRDRAKTGVANRTKTGDKSENRVIPLKEKLSTSKGSEKAIHEKAQEIGLDFQAEETQEAVDRIFNPIVKKVDQKLKSLQFQLNQLLKNTDTCKNTDEIEFTALQIYRKLPGDRAVYYALMKTSIVKMDLHLIYLMSHLGTSTVLETDIYDFMTNEEIGDFFNLWNNTVFSQMAMTDFNRTNIEFTGCDNKIRYLELPNHILDVDIPGEVLEKIYDQQIVIDFAMFSNLDPKSTLFRDKLYALIEAVEELPEGIKKIQENDLAKYLKKIRSSLFGYVIVDLSNVQQWSLNDSRSTYQLKIEKHIADRSSRSSMWRTYRTENNKLKKLLVKEGSYYLKFNGQVRKTFSINQANQEIRIVLK